MPVLKIKQEDGTWGNLGGTCSLDGGNADTLDGKHAEEFALASDVAEQISDALANFSSGKTLAEHFTEEMMVLTSLQYGDTLPDPGVPGRIFFKRVAE